MNTNAINNAPVLNVADMSQWRGEVRSQAMPQSTSQEAASVQAGANNYAQQVQDSAAPPVSAAEPSVSATVSGKIDFLA